MFTILFVVLVCLHLPHNSRCMDLSPSQILIYPEVKQLMDEGKAIVIDVRNTTELQQYGSMPGSHSVPLGELSEALRMSEKDFQTVYGFRKPKLDETIIFSCRSGRRSVTAMEKAMEVGYKNLLNYGGGYLDYEKHYKRSKHGKHSKHNN